MSLRTSVGVPQVGGNLRQLGGQSAAIIHQDYQNLLGYYFLMQKIQQKLYSLKKNTILSEDEALVEIFSFEGNSIIGTITNFSTETITVVSGTQADLFEIKTYSFSKGCEPSYGQATQDCFNERTREMGWLSVALNIASIATRGAGYFITYAACAIQEYPTGSQCYDEF